MVEFTAILGLDEWDYWFEGSFNLRINMWTVWSPICWFRWTCDVYLTMCRYFRRGETKKHKNAIDAISNNRFKECSKLCCRVILLHFWSIFDLFTAFIVERAMAGMTDHCLFKKVKPIKALDMKLVWLL